MHLVRLLPEPVATCPKFNLVGPEEIDNLTLAQTIAKVQKKDLIYEFMRYFDI